MKDIMKFEGYSQNKYFHGLSLELGIWVRMNKTIASPAGYYESRGEKKISV